VVPAVLAGADLHPLAERPVPLAEDLDAMRDA
jgi:hypothetical protein